VITPDSSFGVANAQTEKGKGKFHRVTGHEDPEEKQRCGSTFSVISAVDGSGWSAPRPDQFTPKKRSVPHYTRG